MILASKSGLLSVCKLVKETDKAWIINCNSKGATIMFTAKDMHNKLKAAEAINEDELDAWLEQSALEDFIGHGQCYAYACTLSSRGWKPSAFIDALNARGFNVDFSSDQREGDSYKITIPPQER